MCGNPFKVIKNIISPPKPSTPKIEIEAPAAPPPDDEEIRRQREELEAQRQEFLEAQRQFNEDQRKFLQEAKQQQAQPVIIPTIERRQSAPATASEVENAIASRRRGRRSLRIPLASTTAGAGGTGLNVPRG